MKWPKDPLTKLEVQPSTIQIGKQLGKGNFGTVYEAKWSGSRVAVKIIQFEQVKNSPITREREISVLLLVTIYIANMPVNNIELMFMSSRHLPHPHITMILVWAKEVPSTFYIVANLVNGPSLFRALFAQTSKLQVRLLINY